MKNKITKVIAICLVCLSLFSISAFALTSYQSYVVDVPALNGSVMTTEQTKSKTAYSGNINVSKVGGGKKLDCRMRDEDKSAGAWVNNVTTGSKETLLSRASHEAGDKMHVYFSNKLTTVVDVTTSGTWRCDS
ncbi:MAG: hypothetical protein IJ300_14865 [Clostridia bacterium]|nr:hypothetical protein [Clostridia bacterium]MBQ8767295.1 hypothetical protein [Clostridia bacterium]